MSIVTTPLANGQSGLPVSAGLTVRAMQVGQHVMAVLLTTVGVIRAITGGTSPAAAVTAGVAILLWHTLGTLLPKRGQSARQSAQLMMWWLLGFALVWVAAVAVSAEFAWVAFLLWLLAGHLLSLWWAAVFSVLVFAVVVLAPLMHHGTTSYANVFGPLVGGVFAFGISRGYLQLLRDAAEREQLLASLTRAQHEATALQDELVLAQRQSGVIAERTRLSREIHDTVAQALSSIRLFAHAELERTPSGSTARTLTQIQSLAGDSLADVRRIVAALAPAELDEALSNALGRMLNQLHEHTGINTEIHVDESLPQLPSEVEIALLRTAQSGLANVRFHSGATRVVLSLIDAEDLVRLDIRDDGRGFDASAWTVAGGPLSAGEAETAASVPTAPSANSGSAAATGFGLRFMSDRLRELGGGLDIESTLGEGTAISAYLPIFRPTAQLIRRPEPNNGGNESGSDNEGRSSNAN